MLVVRTIVEGGYGSVPTVRKTYLVYTCPIYFLCSVKDGDEDGENVPDNSRGGAVGGGSVR